MKLKRQIEQQMRISKYELGDFCYQYGFEPIKSPQANRTQKRPNKKYRSIRAKRSDPPPKYHKLQYHKRNKPSTSKKQTTNPKLGDFNIIRFPEEKLGGCRLSPEMQAFSDWINSHALLDL